MPKDREDTEHVRFVRKLPYQRYGRLDPKRPKRKQCSTCKDYFMDLELHCHNAIHGKNDCFKPKGMSPKNVWKIELEDTPIPWSTSPQKSTWRKREEKRQARLCRKSPKDVPEEDDGDLWKFSCAVDKEMAQKRRIQEERRQSKLACKTCLFSYEEQDGVDENQVPNDKDLVPTEDNEDKKETVLSFKKTNLQSVVPGKGPLVSSHVPFLKDRPPYGYPASTVVYKWGKKIKFRI